MTFFIRTYEQDFPNIPKITLLEKQANRLCLGIFNLSYTQFHKSIVECILKGGYDMMATFVGIFNGVFVCSNISYGEFGF